MNRDHCIGMDVSEPELTALPPAFARNTAPMVVLVPGAPTVMLESVPPGVIESALTLE